MHLYRVSAPNFVAGLCLDGKNVVWETAPILHYMREKPFSWVIAYCRRKNWEVEHVSSD